MKAPICKVCGHSHWGTEAHIGLVDERYGRINREAARQRAAQEVRAAIEARGRADAQTLSSGPESGPAVDPAPGWRERTEVKRQPKPRKTAAKRGTVRRRGAVKGA